ncbi:MAG TPA: hypothetical protein VN843_19395 [Anaerolineales bacterium]|nr:hypothetical protein [Anaerolineales bacterium]
MDLSKQFSLTDFLAYFFPGLFAVVGLYLLILLTPIQTALIPADITTGIVFLAISYVVGIVLSGFSEWIEKTIERNTRQSIPIDGFQDDVVTAFNDIFDKNTSETMQWSQTHFFLCRSLILEKMPAIAQVILRQSSLRQLRRNLLLPIIIWLLAGIAWGTWNTLNGHRLWGFLVVVLSIIVSTVSYLVTVARMRQNEEREVREVLTAFLVGYRTGLLARVQAPTSQTS